MNVKSVPGTALTGAAASDQLLRIAGSLARFGGWSIDLVEQRVHWSDEVAAIHDMPPGYSPTLQDGLDFYAPEYRDEITRLFGACARDGTPYDSELQIISARGRRAWVRAIGEAIRDEAGRVVRVQGAFQDITERKQGAIDLAASEVRYRTLFEKMTSGFVLFEVVAEEQEPVDLVILAGNREFETTTGLQVNAVAGQRLTHALPGIERDASDWIGIYGRVALSGEPARFELRSDLLGRDFLVSAFQSGEKRCAVTFLDITERRRAEREVQFLHAELQQRAVTLEHRVAERTAELERAKVRAEAADRAKSAFLATMSHELRTPLNSIIGFTDVLLLQAPGPLNVEQQRQLGIVQRSSQHLLSLITDVLDLAKIEAGQLTLEKLPFDLCGTVVRVSGVFRDEAHKRGLQFVFEPESSRAPTIGDERRVEQVLNNLLSNALKFTPSGSIQVSLDLGNPYTITVADSGIGIRQEDLGKLFHQFSQIDSRTPTSREGTGLGLAISRHLVEAMGGRISVESRPGAGSRFQFTIPAGYP